MGKFSKIFNYEGVGLPPSLLSLNMSWHLHPSMRRTPPPPRPSSACSPARSNQTCDIADPYGSYSTVCLCDSVADRSYFIVSARPLLSWSKFEAYFGRNWCELRISVRLERVRAKKQKKKSNPRHNY